MNPDYLYENPNYLCELWLRYTFLDKQWPIFPFSSLYTSSSSWFLIQLHYSHRRSIAESAMGELQGCFLGVFGLGWFFGGFVDFGFLVFFFCWLFLHLREKQSFFLQKGRKKNGKKKNKQAKIKALFVASTKYQRRRLDSSVPQFLPVENQINWINLYGWFKYHMADAFIQSDIPCWLSKLSFCPWNKKHIPDPDASRCWKLQKN